MLIFIETYRDEMNCLHIILFKRSEVTGFQTNNKKYKKKYVESVSGSQQID